MSNAREQNDTEVPKPSCELLLPGFSSDDDMSEGRARQRRSFNFIHEIAARVGPELPREADYFAVRFYDLSEGGFSFLLRSRPSFNELVAALSTGSNVTYVAAEVRHCTDVILLRSGLVERIEAARVDHSDLVDERGTRMVLVGCRFTEHLGTEAQKKKW